MRKISLVLALAAVVALCNGASAQQVYDGQKMRTTIGVPVAGWDPADTTGHLLQATANGLKVREAFPATGYTMIAPAFLSTCFLHYSGGSSGVSGSPSITTFVKDSSSVEDTQGYNRLGLLLYPTLDDSTGSVLLAYSVRIHQSASHDSLSTYTIPKIRTLTAPSDTTGSFLDRTESAAVNDSSGVFPYERFLVVSQMNGPRGVFIPLTDRDGANIAGNKISVVWRHIRTYKPDNSAGWLRGQEQKLFLRADLVGRRD